MAKTEPRPLQGLAILIVEDEFLIAAQAQEAVENAGGVVLGPVNSLAAAQRLLAEATPDCVILDLSLGSQNGDVLIAKLAEQGTPFVVASGFDVRGGARLTRTDLIDRGEILAKPYSEDELLAAIVAALAR